MVVDNRGGGPGFSIRPCLSLLYRSSPHLSLFGICCILGVWWWMFDNYGYLQFGDGGCGVFNGGGLMGIWKIFLLVFLSLGMWLCVCSCAMVVGMLHDENRE